MIKSIRNIIGLGLVILMSGCMVVKHKTTRPDGSVDSGSAVGFLSSTKVAEVNTQTTISTNGLYNHRSGAKDLENKGDTEFIKALAAGIAAGIAESMKKSAGVP